MFYAQLYIVECYVLRWSTLPYKEQPQSYQHLTFNGPDTASLEGCAETFCGNLMPKAASGLARATAAEPLVGFDSSAANICARGVKLYLLRLRHTGGRSASAASSVELHLQLWTLPVLLMAGKVQTPLIILMH